MFHGVNYDGLSEIREFIKASMMQGAVKLLSDEEKAKFNAAVEAMREHAMVIKTLTTVSYTRFNNRHIDSFSLA